MPNVSTDCLSLAEFLRLPEFKPALEYIGGRIVQKMSPKLPHSIIQGEIFSTLNAYARPRKLGRAYTELRAVFGGSARTPDVSYYSAERLAGFVLDEEIVVPPDIAIEILSPGQSVGELRLKLRHSISHGTKLAWLIHSKAERVHVIRPGQKSVVFMSGEILTGEPVLPGFTLPVAEVFGWLDHD